MIPQKVKKLIEKYCMGVVPSDDQMDEINDMVLTLGADVEETSAYMKEMIAGPTKEERDKAARIKAEKQEKLKAERKKKEEEKRKKVIAEEAARKEKERQEQEAEAERKVELNKYKSICLEAFDEIISYDSPYEKPSALSSLLSGLLGGGKSAKLENAKRRYDDALKKLDDLIPWKLSEVVGGTVLYYFDKENETLFIKGGSVFRNDPVRINWSYVISERRWITKVVILNGIRSIDLSGIENVEYVVLPDSLQHIEKFCFAKSNLEYLYSSKPLSFIGEGAFAECKNLRSIYVSEKTKVGENAIFECDSLPDNILSLLGYYRRFRFSR